MTLESVEILALVQKNYPRLAEKELQEEIAAHSKLMRFKAGGVISEYGSYVKFIPLIFEGVIKVTTEDEEEGRELLLYYLQPGEACSLSFTCCMMNKKSTVRTEAEEDSLLAGIPIRLMDEWMTRYQSWKNFVMITYDKKITDLVKVVDSIAFRSLDSRMVDYLRKRVETSGSRVINASHQDIASDLNASREAISRLLKNLEKEGVVKLGRNQLLFKK